MLVAAVMLVVTGRTPQASRAGFSCRGTARPARPTSLIWMFNGKRSHSLIGVLATVCALYLTRLKRPSWPVLITTAFLGVSVVTIAIGWREDLELSRDRSPASSSILADFQPENPRQPERQGR